MNQPHQIQIYPPEIADVHMCPVCGKGSTVRDSRPSKYVGITARKRRRMCVACNFKFTTYEVPAYFLVNLLKDRMELHRLQDVIRTALTDT